METIAVFKSPEQAVLLSKKIKLKGYLAYVATRNNGKNGLNYKLMVHIEDIEAVRTLLMK